MTEQAGLDVLGAQWFVQQTSATGMFFGTGEMFVGNPVGVTTTGVDATNGQSFTNSSSALLPLIVPNDGGGGSRPLTFVNGPSNPS